MPEISKRQTEKSTDVSRAPRRDQPSHPLVNLRDEIDRLFEDFTGGASPFAWPSRFFESAAGAPQATPFGSARTMVPATEVAETEKEYRFTFDLPGIDQKSVDISLDEDILTVKAENQEERDEQNETYHLTERRYGTYQRSFRLPEDADGEKIKADMKNGVLTLAAPKKAEAKKNVRKISIGSK